MARIRTIKPDFMDSADVRALSREARLFFLQLLTEADDQGRLKYSPKRLAGVLYPGDDDVDGADIERWIKECEARHMLLSYTVEDQKLLWVVGFNTHQKISHPTTSKLASPGDVYPDQDSCNSPESSGVFPEDSGSLPEKPSEEREQGTGKGNREREQGSPKRPPSDDAVTLAALLADLIDKNGIKRPTVKTNWLVDMDRTIRLKADGDVEETERVLRWCQADSFWFANILSPAKFNAKWDTLRAQSLSQKPRSGTSRNGRAPESWDVLGRIHSEAKAQEALDETK